MKQVQFAEHELQGFGPDPAEHWALPSEFGRWSVVARDYAVPECSKGVCQSRWYLDTLRLDVLSTGEGPSIWQWFDGNGILICDVNIILICFLMLFVELFPFHLFAVPVGKVLRYMFRCFCHVTLCRVFEPSYQLLSLTNAAYLFHYMINSKCFLQTCFICTLQKLVITIGVVPAEGLLLFMKHLLLELHAFWRWEGIV